jgi:hypothetical protein
MSNALSRVERYSDLAEECRCLAACTFSPQMRTRYSRMADTYATLAGVEEIRQTSLRQLSARDVGRLTSYSLSRLAGSDLSNGVPRTA